MDSPSTRGSRQQAQMITGNRGSYFPAIGRTGLLGHYELCKRKKPFLDWELAGAMIGNSCGAVYWKS